MKLKTYNLKLAFLKKFQVPSSKLQERGVSLIITFFIMTIILAVVLSISIILSSEIKIIRNIGKSVTAFYAADSGIEEILYFDRQQIPENGKRGICNTCAICSFYPTENNYCSECSVLGSDSSPETCTNAEINYITTFNDKRYNVVAQVYPIEQMSQLDVKSYGFYKETTRAIELQVITEE